MSQSSTEWSWAQSLGGVGGGDRGSYRIRRILFGMVQDHCRELGLFEGDTVRCRGRDRRGLELQLSSGSVRRIAIEYAWFIEVEEAGLARNEPRSA